MINAWFGGYRSAQVKADCRCVEIATKQTWKALGDREDEEIFEESLQPLNVKPSLRSVLEVC